MSRSWVAAFLALVASADIAGFAFAADPIADPIRRIIRNGRVHIALQPVAPGLNAPS